MEQTPVSRQVKAFYPMIVVPGMVLLLAPSTVETIMEYFGFRESMGGLLQVTYFAGGVVGILLITHLMQRYSVKRIALSQVAILSVSLLAAAISPWYLVLLFFFLIAGFANGILITFPGVFVTNVCGETSHHQQTILYGFFSLGVVAGPLVSGLIIDNGISWRWAFALPALLIIPLTIPVMLTRFEEIEGAHRLSRGVVKKILDFNSKLFWGLLASVLLYIAAESAVSMWLITFLKEEHGVEIGLAHWILTGLWAALTIGRWICGFLTRKVDPYRILLFLTVASSLLLLAAPLSGTGTSGMILYPFVGLFYSGIYPMLIGYVAWFPSELSSSVFTMFLAAGAAGSTVLPYFVGLVNQFAGLVAGMCSIVIPVLGVLAFVLWIRKDLTTGPMEKYHYEACEPTF